MEHKTSTWNCLSSGKLEYEKLFAVFYDIKVMNAEVFAKGLGKCKLLTSLLGQNVENLDMVAQKFKILSKRTVCGTSLVTFSDTQQGFTVPRGKQMCMENGLCNLCKFCTCSLYL